MKLNLGAGPIKVPGFLSVDSDPSTNPDILIDITKPWPIDDNSVDEVLAYHVFEHIGDGYFDFLKELYRVCKAGTIIDIRVPHHRHDYFFGDPTHIRAITVENLMRFNKASTDGMQNFGKMLDIDLRVVAYKHDVEDYWLEQFKGKSEKEVDFIARTYNNVIREVFVKMAVHK